MEETPGKLMTLYELANLWREERQSRFHKHLCAYCGKWVTNQAMGRKSHQKACKKKYIEAKVLNGEATR